MEINNYRLWTQIAYYARLRPAEFRVQISRLQIGASAVIKAIAFIVTGAAQSELIIRATVNYFTRFVLFSVPAFFFRRLLSKKSIDQFSYQWHFFARHKTAMTCN